MFTGNYERNIDEKSRLIIPVSFRNYLGGKFYLSPGFDKECIYIYPLPEWEELVKKLKILPKSDEDAQEYIRLFFSSSAECEMDRQWRITLPDHLIEYGELGESVVVAGIMEHIEIWASHKWKALKKGDEFRKLSQKVLKHYQI